MAIHSRATTDTEPGGGGNTQELTEMLTRNEIPRDIYDVWFDKYLLKGWLVILKWEVETYPVPNVR